MNGRTRKIAKLIAMSVGFVLVFPVAPASAAPTILGTSLNRCRRGARTGGCGWLWCGRDQGEREEGEGLFHRRRA